MKKIILFFIFISVFSLFETVFAQEIISYKGSGNYILIERTDLRRYDNGKYTGLVSREISSYIIPSEYRGGYIYDGSFFLKQDTRRQNRDVANPINGSISSKFKISPDGILTMIEDNGYPSYRSFPSYPVKKIIPGDVWQAKAERAVDPLFKGVVTRMPVFVQYKYEKDDYLNGEKVHVISAQWATRYGMGNGSYYLDYGGDKELERATGSHKAMIYVSADTGNALLIRDNVDETFFYKDGNQISFKGTVSQFTEYPPAVDRSSLIPIISRVAGIPMSEVEEVVKNLNRDTKSDEGSNFRADGDGNNFVNDDVNNDVNSDVNRDVSSDKNDRLKSDLNGNSRADGDGNNFVNDDVNNAVNSDVNRDVNGDVNKDVSSDKNDRLKSDLNGNSRADGDSNNVVNDDVNRDMSSDVNGDVNRELNLNDSVASPLSKQADKVWNEIKNLSENNEIHEEKKFTGAETGISLSRTQSGIKLTLENIQFEADSTQLVAGESHRIDLIYEILRQIPDAMFLIEGHSASTGNEKGEMQLSVERARTVAECLEKKGMNSSRFITRGWGSSRPVADNSTSSGKAANRRVEITILD